MDEPMINKNKQIWFTADRILSVIHFYKIKYDSNKPKEKQNINN